MTTKTQPSPTPTRKECFQMFHAGKLLDVNGIAEYCGYKTPTSVRVRIRQGVLVPDYVFGSVKFFTLATADAFRRTKRRRICKATR